MVVASAASDLAAAENFSGDEIARLWFGPQIESVVGRVLRNQIDFLHAVGDQRLRLGHDVRLRAGCDASRASAGMMQKLHG